MKNKEVTTYEAKTHLSKYLTMAKKGIEIVIKRGNVPIAKLTALEESKEAKPRRPKVGTRTSGPIEYDDDCFNPLSDEELKEDWGI
ncbi:MAG: type II toxin-antitoxin system Phd/YefM family antitoxin [Bdellovibrionales bacterium]|nr:type II toxin-antitoxin system Phd/YefM family antitoxin [Bdellovibrionales bacterium]